MGQYRVSVRTDSLAERGEFELPVPICEQSDDGVRLKFGLRDELQGAIALQRISSALHALGQHWPYVLYRLRGGLGCG